MKKAIDIVGFSLLSLMLIVGIWLIFKAKNEKSKPNNSAEPVLFSLIFSPPMERHSEVFIDFRQKIIIFKNIDREPIFIHEPPRPNGKLSSEKPEEPTKIIPFVAKLTDKQINDFTDAINTLQPDDYTEVEEADIDGIYYNFGIIFSDKEIRVGNIATNKKANQARLVALVLTTLESTNKFLENEKIFNYYKLFNH